jgi:hypothetical protein
MSSEGRENLKKKKEQNKTKQKEAQKALEWILNG